MALPSLLSPLADVGKQISDGAQAVADKNPLGIRLPVTSVTKVADEENKGMLSRVGDFPFLGDAIKGIPLVGETVAKLPIGTQFGTYFGMEPGWGTAIVDTITDPTLYFGGLGLLKRAPKYVSRQAGRIAPAKWRALDDVTEAMIQKGASDAEIMNFHLKGVDRAARFETNSLEGLYGAIRDAKTPDDMAKRLTAHVEKETRKAGRSTQEIDFAAQAPRLGSAEKKMLGEDVAQAAKGSQLPPAAPSAVEDPLKQAALDAEKMTTGGTLPDDIREAIDDLPMPDGDVVRVWRWEGQKAKDAGGAQGLREGLWFERNPAAYYSQGAKAEDLRYLDLSPDEFKKLQLHADDTEVVVTKELQAKSKKVGPAKTTSPDPLHSSPSHLPSAQASKLVESVGPAFPPRRVTSKVGAKLLPQDAANLPNVRDLDRIKKSIALGRTEETKQLIQDMILQRKGAQEQSVKLLQRIAKGEEISPKELSDALKRVRELHPSQRNRALYGKENRKGLMQYIKMKRLQKDVPRLATTLEDQSVAAAAGMAAKQRSLIDIGLPFSGKRMTLVSGQPVFRAIDKLQAKYPLVFGSTQKLLKTGLVAGNATVATKLDRALRSGNPVADIHSVKTIMNAAVEHTRGFDAEEAFKDVAHVKIHEDNQSYFIAKALEGDFKLAIDGLLQSENLSRTSKAGRARRKEIEQFVIDSIDNPEKYFEVKFQRGAANLKFSPPRGNKGGGLSLLDDVLNPQFLHTPREYGALRKDAPIKITTEMELFAKGLHEKLNEVGVSFLQKGLIEGFIKDYFPRVVKLIKKPEQWAQLLGKKMGRSDISGLYTHGLRRSIPYLDVLRQAEKDGIIVLEKRPDKLLARYFHSAMKAASERRFIERMATSRVQLSADSTRHVPAMIPIQDVERSKELTELVNSGEYVLDKSGAIRNLGEHSGKELDKPFPGGAWVHKNIFSLARNVTDPGLDLVKVPGETGTQKLARTAVRLNSYRKGLLLSASLFHFVALTESAVGSLGSMFGPKGFTDILRGRLSRWANVNDIAQMATKNGLVTGNTLGQREAEVFTRAAQSAYESLRSTRVGTYLDQKMHGALKLPFQAGGGAVQIATHAQELLNNKLWDHYHTGLKLYAWHEHYLRALEKFPLTPADTLARAAAEHANNAFGGLAWEKFWGGSKTGQQLMKFLLLAPDWVAANTRIAWDVFANIAYRAANLVPSLKAAKNGVPVDKLLEVGTHGFVGMSRDLARVIFKGDAVLPARLIVGADVNAKFARAYALRSIVAFSVAENMLNYAFNGHWMEDNPPGREDTVMLPKNWWPNPSKPAFLDFGKQFKEPFRAMDDPMEYLRSKKSTIASDVVALVAGVDFFGRPIVATEGGPLHELASTAGYMAGSMLPISIQQYLRTGLKNLDVDRPEALILQIAAGTGAVPVRQGVPPVPSSGGGGASGRVSVPGFLRSNQFSQRSQRASLAIPIQ